MKFNRNFYRQPMFYIELIIWLWCTASFFDTRLWSFWGITNFIIWVSSLVGIWETLTHQQDN